MTLFEAINFNRELIDRLRQIGFKPDDCRYLDLYSEYQELLNGGGKKTWIIASLAEKYSVSERKIYSIVKRFGTCCTTGAV